jgi:hypothetical protein
MRCVVVDVQRPKCTKDIHAQSSWAVAVKLFHQYCVLLSFQIKRRRWFQINGSSAFKPLLSMVLESFLSEAIIKRAEQTATIKNSFFRGGGVKENCSAPFSKSENFFRGGGLKVLLREIYVFKKYYYGIWCVFYVLCVFL